MKCLVEGHRGSWAATHARALALLGVLFSVACSSGDDGPDSSPLDTLGGADSGGASPGSSGGAPATESGTSGGGASGVSSAGGRGGVPASEGGRGAVSAGRGGAGSGGEVSKEGGRGGRANGGRASGGASSAGAAGSSLGGAGTDAPEDGELAGIVEAHNAVRATVMDSEPLPPLTWSPELAAFAQDWADNLAGECDTIYHRMQRSYGENIAAQWSFSGGPSRNPYGVEAVDAWAGEIECYEFGTINGTERCDAQCIAEQNSSGCGHYTQLVWRNSKRVGCGYASCDAGNRQLMEIVVCNYDPPGNYVGQTPY